MTLPAKLAATFPVGNALEMFEKENTRQPNRLLQGFGNRSCFFLADLWSRCWTLDCSISSWRHTDWKPCNKCRRKKLTFWSVALGRWRAIQAKLNNPCGLGVWHLQTNCNHAHGSERALQLKSTALLPWRHELAPLIRVGHAMRSCFPSHGLSLAPPASSSS
jgi:hypothetical protein